MIHKYGINNGGMIIIGDMMWLEYDTRVING
jgi:hypothetical protein